ncbi:thermonuclease family protein [Halogranum rubrum]|uniref:thermonuclease family protein n=1 Tax=Halogranum rubrum TaxID=553466 RepID=UPI000A2F0475|nr:thermonuclease family protein [Halogranum salarium]
MRRDTRHVFVVVALVAVVLSAGCAGVLSPKSESSQSGSLDDPTPVPDSGTTAGPVSDAPREQPREASPSPTSTPTQTASPTPTNSSSTPTQTVTATPTTTQTPAPTQTTPASAPAPAPAPAPSSGGSVPSSSGSSSSTSTPTPTETTSTPSTETSAEKSTETTVEVRRVLDGDTIAVVYPDGSTGLVDLAGVDTPDLYGGVDTAAFGVPDTAGGETYLYAWGWTARRALQETLTDASVRIEVVDGATPAVDDFPPTVEYDNVVVAYVSADTQDANDAAVNRALLRDGLARATDTDHPRRTTFSETMEAAQDASRGLWDTNTDLSAP